MRECSRARSWRPSGPSPEGSHRILSLPGRERILFVDDEQPIVDLIKHGLGGLGYLVTAFRISPEALEAFKSAPA